MEELKILVEMVAGLPTMAIWVLVGFFVYKVVVVGSVFGVLRLGIIKAHDWLANRAVNGRTRINEITCAVPIESIMDMLRMVKTSTYVHESDINFIKRAIKEKQEREAK
jgi:hypothetical protein